MPAQNCPGCFTGCLYAAPRLSSEAPAPILPVQETDQLQDQPLPRFRPVLQGPGSISVEGEISVVISAAGHGHRAEDALIFAPCDDLEVVVGVELQIAAAVFLDDRGSGCGLGVRGLVPSPGAAGIGRQENVIAVAAVDRIPSQSLLGMGGRSAHDPAADGGGRRRDIFNVGPSAVYPLAVSDAISSDLDLGDMVVGRVIEISADCIPAVKCILGVASVRPAPERLIALRAVDLLPVDLKGGEIIVEPSSEMTVLRP